MGEVTAPSGLDVEQAAQVAEEFGVTLQQVRRDHFISLALAAMGTLKDQLVLFGGTALAHSYLEHGRLSEDIDLIAKDSRPDVADSLTLALNRTLYLPTRDAFAGWKTAAWIDRAAPRDL